MAVSKRTRFEVLRRDNFTCRYCRSVEGEMVVDHVTPVALGGGDDPSNLVAACRDCNSGKASTSPDAASVAQVAEDAVRWATAMQQVAKVRAGERRKLNRYVDAFDKNWCSWTTGYGEKFDRPDGWRASIERFYQAGLPIEDLNVAADKACGNRKISDWDRFRYMCGICWNVVTEMQEAARSLVTDGVED
jgi:hypothetical protein